MAGECCCCGEVGPAFGKPGFERSIETIRCIRPSCTNLKLTGSMLRDKNERSYNVRERLGKVKGSTFIFMFSAYVDQLHFKTILNLDLTSVVSPQADKSNSAS